MLRPLAIVCAILAATAALQPEAVHAREAYLVKERKIDSVPEALSQLRRFIPLKENFDDKCQRYAVLLKQMAVAPTNQFAIAELGLIKANSINNQFKEIDVETLRQLYMDAINKSLHLDSGDHFDLSMVELVDCLIRKFRSHDAKARAFLNTPELQETIEQYKSIMSLPVAFSQDPSARHPSLAVGQLQPAIVRLMLDLYNGDENRLVAHFSGPAPPAEPRPIAAASAEAPESGSGAQAEVAAADQPLPMSQEQAGLSQEEEAYLARVNEAIRRLYSNLPVVTSLARRCEAYANVMEANPERVGQQLVQEIVQQTTANYSQPGPAKFLPGKETRESFLIALDSFAPDQRDSVWLDLMDCVFEWENDDADIKAYLSNPELMKVLNEMMSSLENNAPQEQQEQQQ